MSRDCAIRSAAQQGRLALCSLHEAGPERRASVIHGMKRRYRKIVEPREVRWRDSIRNVDSLDERPDRGETTEQRQIFVAAQDGFTLRSGQIDRAANSFDYTSREFHQLEGEFLALIDELRRTDVEQIRNLAHLEGMRIRLLTCLDGDYRHAVNELADALLTSIGIDPPPTP